MAAVPTDHSSLVCGKVAVLSGRWNQKKDNREIGCEDFCQRCCYGILQTASATPTR